MTEPPQQASSPFKPPPGAVGLPGMVQQSQSLPAQDGGGLAASDSQGMNGTGGADERMNRRMSAKNFIARAPSLSQRKDSGNNGGGTPGAPAGASDEAADPIAKALANLRLRQGARSPAPGGGSAPPPLSKSPGPPGSIRDGMTPQEGYRASSPAPHQQAQHRAPSPAAAFMQAPERSASPMPVEQVVGQYGQAFPGERKNLSRQNSFNSRASQSATRPPERARSPKPPEGPGAGFAGVGARGRSPSPAPFAGPGGQQQQQQVRPPPQQQQRPSTPLGISLDASGSVTHDQLAEQYRQRMQASTPSQQPPQMQQQPQQQMHQQQYSHAGQPPAAQAMAHQGSMNSQMGQMPNPYQQGWQPQPQASPQPQPQQQVPPQQSQQPFQPSQSPANMAGSIGRAQAASPYGHQQQPSQVYANPYAPGQQPGQQAGYTPAPAQQQAPTAETPAAAYMQSYRQAHSMHMSQPSTATLAQQQQWGQPPQQQPAVAAPSPSYGTHPPTGQFSDGGKPILFYGECYMSPFRVQAC